MSRQPAPEMLQLQSPPPAVPDVDPSDHSITSIAVSPPFVLNRGEPARTLVAAASLLGTVTLFDVFGENPARPVAQWKAHDNILNYVSFLQVINQQAPPQQQQADDEQQQQQQQPPSQVVVILATGSEDQTLRIWNVLDIINGNPNQGKVALFSAPAEVNCITLSSNGELVYAGCEDGSVAVYNVRQYNDPACNNGGRPADRFLVGEGSVNDMSLISTPYGDLLFTVTDDGSLRAWRTAPGQRAPQEAAGPSTAELQQMLAQLQQNSGDGDISNNGSNQQQEQGGPNSNVNSGEANEQLQRLEDEYNRRQLIQAQIGDAGADRLLSTFDMLRGSQTNHVVFAEVAGQPTVLVACNNGIIGIGFDLQRGAFAEEPCVVFQGHDDFVRGLHPSSSGNTAAAGGQSPPLLFTVGDDGRVGVFVRGAVGQLDPVSMFKADEMNIMSSALVVDPNSGNAAPPLLITGCLNGSVRMWKMAPPLQN